MDRCPCSWHGSREGNIAFYTPPYVPFSLSVYMCISVCMSLSVSMPASLTHSSGGLSLSLYGSRSLFCHCLSMSLPTYLCPLSTGLFSCICSLFRCVYPSLPVSVSTSLSLCHWLSLPSLLSRSLFMHLSLQASVFLDGCLYLCLSLSFSRSISTGCNARPNNIRLNARP